MYIFYLYIYIYICILYCCIKYTSNQKLSSGQGLLQSARDTHGLASGRMLRKSRGVGNLLAQVLMAKWLFPSMGVQCPCNESPTDLGSMLGPLISRNSQNFDAFVVLF